ncbi:hypothetical protein L226DRAFT_364725 [Lentinus tigrinus ALCF2SS1-7]|uniref:uncharacterized protein n=1 Tax=Lentinus tigrinus ALCF2SS1-7 TaxID=1328758 RepID=UPI001166157F|nr:hypothetical protein L226DRAFT_364725 [Lentinus tigrinus ALCF2SS1-7]
MAWSGKPWIQYARAFIDEGHGMPLYLAKCGRAMATYGTSIADSLVRIGDVGVFDDDGGFDVFLNSLPPGEHADHVPNVTIQEVDPRLLKEYTVRKHDIEASITLHGRVESKVLDIASYKIIDHIQNHFDEWHEIINNRYGMDKEVCFVYGTTTASSASLSVVHRSVGNSDSKYGFPFTQEAQPATPFIRVYMVSKTEDKNPDHPLHSFIADAFKFEYDPIQRSWNPVEDLIAYIQWRRDKERRDSLAIASYQDIMCIFEHGVPSNVSLTLWREDRDIYVNEHGVATIRLDQLTSPRSQSHMATFLGICIRKSLLAQTLRERRVPDASKRGWRK